MRMFATIVLLSAVWLLWSGHFEPLMLGLGAISIGLVAWLSRRMGLVDDESFPFALAWELLKFIPWVLWQVIKTNIEVARLILAPSLPIQPHLVRLPIRQRTVFGQVIHANTITITPGTVTLDVRHNHFLVHALTDGSIDESGAGELDRRVARLEGQAIALKPPSTTDGAQGDI